MTRRIGCLALLLMLGGFSFSIPAIAQDVGPCGPAATVVNTLCVRLPDLATYYIWDGTAWRGVGLGGSTFVIPPRVFATLPGSAPDGVAAYCTDCGVSAVGVCQSGGTGQLARRRGGFWLCQ